MKPISAETVEAYIGLGSNLGNSIETLNSAYQAIAALKTTEALALSGFYQTKPMGPQDQPDYVNAVAKIRTELTAQALLQALQAIENQHGRIRLQRWGARTLDLDLLLYGQAIISTENLQVPHPGLAERNFVLYPLADIAPADLMIPDQGSLAQLLAACPANDMQRLPV